MTDLAYSKVIDIADFEDAILQPHLHEMARGDMIRFGLAEPTIIPDSKQWECAMMLRTLSDFGLMRPGALLAGIGAGTEETTFALASHGAITFPIDRYLEATPWSDVAPPGMMVRPGQFSPYPLQDGAVIPVHGDARALPFTSGFFDGVYSAGSIEHFGSLDAVAAAAEEIGRILKPGGVAVISTEFRLEGPNDQRWFSDDCILFTPKLLREHIIEPSALELIGDLDVTMSSRTFDSRVVLVDFLDKAKRVQTLVDKQNAYPNLILFHLGFLFCSVHVALRKPEGAAGPAARGPRSSAYVAQVAADATRAGAALTRRIEDGPTAREPVGTDPALLAELDRHRAALALFERSRSLRFTRPLRDAAHLARQVPVVRQLGVGTLRMLRALRGMRS